LLNNNSFMREFVSSRVSFLLLYTFTIDFYTFAFISLACISLRSSAFRVAEPLETSSARCRRGVAGRLLVSDFEMVSAASCLSCLFFDFQV
jgi:hypothetical protein